MMAKNQTIESGDDSINLQGKDVAFNQNNYGISYSDAKEIAMDVFKRNFYDLGDNVKNIVNERAEEILDNYFEKLLHEGPKYIENTADPDIRYLIYEVQKNYARRGDKITEELLVETLVQRTISKNNLTKELVLNEAIITIPKLTSKQMDILSLIFLVRYGNYIYEVPVESFNNIIDKTIEDLTISKKRIFFEHLQYAGCLYASIGSIDFKKAIQNKFPQFKTKEDVETEIKSNEFLSYLESIWNETNLCHSTLNSVGIAIAIANVNFKTKTKYDLDIWLGE